MLENAEQNNSEYGHFQAMLKILALTSAGKASYIVYIANWYLLKHPSGCLFQLGKTTKTSTRTRQKKPLKFYPFRENKNLCVSHQIDFYFDKMKEFHKIKVQILLSFTKSHKGVTIPDGFRYLIYRELTPKFSPITQQGLLALQNPKHQVYVQMIY